MVLAVLMLGIYIGTREGIEIGRAQLEPQIRENAESIASLQCEISVLADQLIQASELLTFIGITSWYGDKEHGRQQASSVKFDKHKLTAASKFLPFGSRWWVTNLENGRLVAVEILDNGPNITGRMLDLSLAAANQLQMVHRGIVWTRIAPAIGKTGKGD
jgi:rare lipoprotein A